MFSRFLQKQRGTWKADALAGLRVALALVPGSIAFARKESAAAARARGWNICFWR